MNKKLYRAEMLARLRRRSRNTARQACAMAQAELARAQERKSGLVELLDGHTAAVRASLQAGEAAAGGYGRVAREIDFALIELEQQLPAVRERLDGRRRELLEATSRSRASRLLAETLQRRLRVSQQRSSAKDAEEAYSARAARPAPGGGLAQI